VKHTLEAAPGRRPLVSLAAAIFAVLAALGTLFTHHRSIAALSEKNQAILVQGRATDTYNAYEAKQIRFNIYQALLTTDLARDPASRARLQAIAEKERESSPAVLDTAKALAEEAESYDARAEVTLKSYETLLFATTFFEIAIVMVSIAALASARILLPVGAGLAGVGIVLFAAGLLQGR
jgi:hypothetical protein